MRIAQSQQNDSGEKRFNNRYNFVRRAKILFRLVCRANGIAIVPRSGSLEYRMQLQRFHVPSPCAVLCSAASASSPTNLKHETPPFVGGNHRRCIRTRRECSQTIAARRSHPWRSRTPHIQRLVLSSPRPRLQTAGCTFRQHNNNCQPVSCAPMEMHVCIQRVAAPAGHCGGVRTSRE